MAKMRFHLLLVMSTISVLAMPLYACATPNVNNNQQEIYKALETEKARIDKIQLNPLDALTKEELDSINETNLLDYLTDQLGLKDNLNYTVIALNKNEAKNLISFQIKIEFEKNIFVVSETKSVSYILNETTPDHKPEPAPKPDPNPNPEINDEKYKAAHTLRLVNMQTAESTLKIIEQTPLFQTKKNELLEEIKNFDFIYQSTSDRTKKVYELISEIGIYGDWGTEYLEKMKYAPRSWDPDNYMVQKYLLNFEVPTNVVKHNINLDNLIQQNQFGFLPSNLSQFLYYLNLDDIATLFNVPNVADIKMNFDDEAGTAQILVTTTAGSQHLFELDSTTSALTKNHDYRQYIYDRSFKVTLPVQAQMKINRNEVLIAPHQAIGTSWIIDRIKGPSITGDNYQFLMATNMHVMDFTYGFSKNFWSSTNKSYWTYNLDSQVSNLSLVNRTYDTYWDGGLISRGELNNSGNNKDEFAWQAATSNHAKYQYFSKRSPDNVEGVKLYRPTVSDPDKIPSNNFKENNVDVIKSEDVIDAVWYTPEFSTTGIYTNDTNTVLGPILDLNKTLSTWDNNDLTTGYQRYEGRRVGKTSNAGADFVISKITLTRQQVKTILPTLEPLLDTPKESEWYIGLGKGSKPIEVSANSSLFTGGYPEGGWKTLKSAHGRINAQQRYFHDDLSSVQSYWTRYDEQKNLSSNDYRGIPNWYKTQFKSHSMSDTQEQKHMPHGMEIRKVLQQSYMYISDPNQSFNAAMKRGASGSMVINSRFELAGILFGWTYTTDDGITIDKQKHSNLVSLIKNYTQENKNLNIVEQVINKLRNENLTAVKMMNSIY